ncbi:MAG TPA: hypothetical protein DCP62_04280 [Erysipelotrichaceae bacterium]|nr:hypothetical protein [Erysipelotrichaceae bacterium]
MCDIGYNEHMRNYITRFLSLLITVGLLLDPMGVFVVAHAKDKPIETVENQPVTKEGVQRLVVTLTEDAKIGDFAGQFKIRSRYPRQHKLLVEVENTEEAIEALSSRPDVVSVTLDHDLELAYVPSDTYYAGYQWNLKNMGLESVWGTTVGIPSVIIAVIDTGVGPYSDFGTIVNGADMTGTTVLEDTYPGQYSSDGGYHGTAVASLISSQMNAYGIAGMAPGVAIMPVKVFPTGSGTASTLTVAEGVVWAVDHGADIINLSLGGDDPQSELEEAIEYANVHGVMVVAASGNDGYTDRISYPARYEGVISVGSSNQGNQVSSYSNRGPGLDIVAPGENILLYYRVNQMFSWFSGTSFAAPTVAAALGLLESAFPTLSDDVKERLLYSSADDYGAIGFDTDFGYGVLDVGSLFLLAQSPGAVDDNDSFDTADTLALDTSVMGRFDLVQDNDIYTLTLTSAQPIELIFESAGSLGMDWRFYGSQLNLIHEESLVLGDGEIHRSLQMAQGKYYFAFSATNKSVMPYLYTFTVRSADSTPPLITMLSKGNVLESGMTSDEDVVVEISDETDVQIKVTRDDIDIEWPVDGRFILNGVYRIDVTDTVGNTSSVTFTLLKSGTYPVSFSTLSDPMPSLDVEYGTAIGSLAEPIRLGYVFEGWFTDSSYLTPWSIESDLVVNAMTLVAKWSKMRLTVTFNSMGGTPVGSQTLDYGSLLYRPANPTKAGYLFENWYHDSTYTRLFDFNQAIESGTTIVAKWVQAPTTVSNLKVTSTSISTLNLTWTAQNVVGYEIYRATGTSTSYAKIGESALASYTSSALSAGVSYSFKVRAFTLVNNLRVYGAFSLIAVGKPIPSTPVVSGVSISYNSVKISWPAVSGASAYQIYRATSVNGPYYYWTTTTSLSYTNSSLTTNATYVYKVRAYRTLTSGRLYGNFSSATVVKPIPATPTMSTSVLSYSSVKASWSAVSGASGYEVYRSSSMSDPFVFAYRTTGTSYTFVNQTFNRAILLKVRAYRIVNNIRIYGNFTNFATVTPNVTAPRLSATSLAYDTIKLGWSSVAGATGYAVEALDPSTNQFVEIADTGSLGITHPDRPTGVTQTYRIRSYRWTGETKVYSAYSANLLAKAIPATVGSPKTTSQSYTSIAIQFAPVAGASGYEIYRSTSSTGTYLGLTTIYTTGFTNGALNFNASYYYKVRAFTTTPAGRVYGNFSSIVSAKTALNVPTMTLKSESVSSIRIAWPSVPGATAYQIFRASTISGTYTRVVTTTSTSYLNTGLNTGTTYYYKVRAYRIQSGVTYYGGYSTAQGIKPIPSTPLLNANANANGTVDVAWTAVTGASGYELSVKIDGESTPTVSSFTSTQTQLVGLPVNVGIQISIRSYKIVNSVKIYSEPSAWVSVMIPMTS